MKDKNWIDWEHIFMNYLCTIPVIYPIPIVCFVRDHNAADPTPHTYFLVNCITMETLNGKTFDIDSADIHMQLVNFIAGDEIGEAKIQVYYKESNRRLDMKDLILHYLGVRLYAMDITVAENFFNALF